MDEMKKDEEPIDPTNRIDELERDIFLMNVQIVSIVVAILVTAYILVTILP